MLNDSFSVKQGFFFGSDQEMLNAAELLERNFGVQFPEELDGTIDLQASRSQSSMTLLPPENWRQQGHTVLQFKPPIYPT